MGDIGNVPLLAAYPGAVAALSAYPMGHVEQNVLADYSDYVA